MGLAASQARFLAITSRKANCEFRSMELAQQKLSLNRELEAATEDYQYAINATNLVWDPLGDGTCRFPLSYDIMMTPSEYNKYIPYMLSRQDGKIALDERWMEAASKIFNVDEETGTCDGGIKIVDDNGIEHVFYEGDDIVDSNGNPITIRDVDGNAVTDSSGVQLTYKDFAQVQSYSFANFIEGLRESKAISSAVAKRMLQDRDTSEPYYVYYEDAGVGREMNGKEINNIMSISSMMSYIDYITVNAASNYFPVGSIESDLAESLTFDFDWKDYIDTEKELCDEQNYKGKDASSDPLGLGDQRADLSCHMDDKYYKYNGSTSLIYNGHYCNSVAFLDEIDYKEQEPTSYLNISSRAVTLADLLNEDITLSVTGKQDYNKVLETISNALGQSSKFNALDIINYDVDIWFDNLNKQIEGSARAYEGLVGQAQDAYNKHTESKAVDAEPARAQSSLAILTFLDKLAKSMFKLLMPDAYDPDQKKYDLSKVSKENQNAFYVAFTNTIQRLRNNDSDNYMVINGSEYTSEGYAQNAVTNADAYNCWVRYGNQWAISLSNLTEAFLSDFVNGLDSYQDGCFITKYANTSTYITDNAEALYTVNTIDQGDESLWESEFYSAIFNNLCTNGFYQNEMIDEKNYLDNALKNGQLFILAKEDNNFYYQARYAQTNTCIMEEADSAAVAIAERAYAYAKSKINYKEELIDLEMKRLDSEISELTTEYETVKNLVTKNAQSIFKQFQS